jgi:D-sedoheptulose 7-phosphate isomerase
VTLETLYPFLAPPSEEIPALSEDLRRSTEAKAREIVALRDRLRVDPGAAVTACARHMARRFQAGARLFAFGNGGSATDAQALASLFLRPPRGRPLPALALPADMAVVTALANDVSFDVVYARLLAAHGRAGDIALALSTSGSSANVLQGLHEARGRGLLAVGLAGHDGGRMAEPGVVDHLLVVPSSSVHWIQEAQTALYHVLWELIQSLNGGSRDERRTP